MRLTNILVLLFLLAAFGIGSSMYEVSQEDLEQSFAPAIETVNNISIPYNASNYEKIPNAEGLLNVLEKFIHFIGNLFIEVFKAGMIFGHDNPDYFQPDFIIKVIKFICIAFIIGLLIRPLTYIGAFIILGIIYLKDKYRKKKNEQRKIISKD